MNLKLTNVLSDITGVTGFAIIQDIIADERNPHKLATYRDPHGHTSEAEIVAALPCPRHRPHRPPLKNDLLTRAGDVAEISSRVHHAAQEEDIRLAAHADDPESGDGNGEPETASPCGSGTCHWR